MQHSPKDSLYMVPIPQVLKSSDPWVPRPQLSMVYSLSRKWYVTSFICENISYDSLLISGIWGKSQVQPFSERQSHPPFNLGQMYAHTLDSVCSMQCILYCICIHLTEACKCNSQSFTCGKLTPNLTPEITYRYMQSKLAMCQMYS